MTTPKIAQHPTIKATGAKGYLQWLASDSQMSKVYQKIRPQLIAMISSGQLPQGPGTGGLRGLGTCCNMAYCNACYASVSASLCAGTSAPASDIVTNQAPSSGSASSSWLSTVTGLVSAAGSAVSTAENISVANQANQIQLARAKAGQAPLNLSSYGISTTPGFNLGLSSSTLGVVVLVAALGAGAFLLSRKSH